MKEIIRHLDFCRSHLAAQPRQCLIGRAGTIGRLLIKLRRMATNAGIDTATLAGDDNNDNTNDTNDTNDN